MIELLIALAALATACLAPAVFMAFCVAFHAAPSIASRFFPNPYLIELQQLRDENAALRENVKQLTTDTVEFRPIRAVPDPPSITSTGVIHLPVSDDFPTAS